MTFCTAINCMDGRVQLPVNEYLTQNYGIKYVDTVTEPGPVKLLSSDSFESQKESILYRTRLSIECHNSSVIAIVAHYDCAGNPVSDEKQINQLLVSADFLSGLFPECTIVPLWLNDKLKVIKY